VIKKSPQLFFELAKEILSSGNEFRFNATGISMQPFILDGDTITISPIADKKLKIGQVAFYYNDVNHLLAHRVHGVDKTSNSITYVIKGDGLPYDIEYIDHNTILGFAVKAERGEKQIHLDSIINRYFPLIYFRSNICKTKVFNIIKAFFRKLKRL